MSQVSVMVDDKLLLEILKSLQTGQAELRREIAAMRVDLSLQLDAVRQHQMGTHSDDLAQRQALDELRERVERIERRLEIAE